jgi:PAS domain S-box-containing protein
MECDCILVREGSRPIHISERQGCPMTKAQRGCILVVDDEAELLAVLSEKLAQQGYDVVSCSGGRGALGALQERTFDVLLTDLMMPDMDGVALLRAALEIDPHLAGIIMTGQATVPTAVEALKVGALDYILKPFKTPALLPVLARAFEVRRLRLDNLQLRETVAILDLCHTISFTTDLNTILDKIADGAVQQCEAQEASIMLPTSDGKELCISTVRGANRAVLLGQRVPINQSVAGWVARTCTPVSLEGRVDDPRCAPVWPRKDIFSAVSMPMLAGGKLVGILNVNVTRRRQPPLLGQLKALGILASAGAGAIEGALLLERQRLAEEKYRSIFNNAVEGIYQSTPGGRFLAVNPALARLAGYDSPDAMMTAITRIEEQFYVDPLRRQEFRRLLEVQDQVERFESEVYRKDGSKRWVAEHTRALRDANGKLVRYDGIIEDITEHKRLVEQFQQAQKMEAIGHLAGGVAHDFNNLLTVINGYGEIVFGRLRADDPLREMVAEIIKAGERAASLTRQLLAFSRKQKLRPQVVDVNALIEDLTKLLRRLIGEDLTLVFVPAPDLGLVKVDRGQLEQVLINLAVNARDAMPTGGCLTLKTQNVDLEGGSAHGERAVQPGKFVLLAMTDTGHGMDEAVRQHIFEPFFTTKEPGKGTGLGLAMVFGFVRQSEGHIQVDSAVGLGTTFRIYLPRVETTRPAVKPSAHRVEMPQGGETILLVEDEERVRHLACLVLRTSGYTLLEARDGQDAASVARQHAGPIHLLVTDVVLPRMSGRQLADVLTASRPAMKTLFVSGYTDDAIVRHGVPSERGLVLQKPFTPTALACRVREVLDAPRPEHATASSGA